MKLSKKRKDQIELGALILLVASSAGLADACDPGGARAFFAVITIAMGVVTLFTLIGFMVRYGDGFYDD